MRRILARTGAGLTGLLLLQRRACTHEGLLNVLSASRTFRLGPRPFVRSSYGLGARSMTTLGIEYKQSSSTGAADPRLLVAIESEGRERGIKTAADWYRVPTSALYSSQRLAPFLAQFNNSIATLFEQAYPGHRFLPWRFDRVPRGYWAQLENQRLLFDWAERELHLESRADWARLSSAQLKSVRIQSILSGQYGGNLQAALKCIYPDVDWSQHFPGPARIRNELDQIGAKLHIHDLSDWYKISAAEVLKTVEGRNLLKTHNLGLASALSIAYPEHTFLPWKFQVVPRKYWADPKDRRRFFDWAGQQLRIRRMSDWSTNVTFEDIERLGGGGMVHKYYSSSVQLALNSLYPESLDPIKP